MYLHSLCVGESTYSVVRRGKSQITDPLSYLINYKRYQKIIYTRTVSNLMINMNKYFVLKNM